MALVEQMVDGKWMSVGELKELEVTPTLLLILCGKYNRDEDDVDTDEDVNGDLRRIGVGERTADNPPGLEGEYDERLSISHCLQVAKDYHKAHKASIKKTLCYTLDQLQRYPWHDNVSRTGWTDKKEADYYRRTGTPPREWTKTCRDKNDKACITWQVPLASLCGSFVSDFIPYVRDNFSYGNPQDEEDGPWNTRVVFFLHCDPPKKIVDLEDEEDEEEES